MYKHVSTPYPSVDWMNRRIINKYYTGNIWDEKGKSQNCFYLKQSLHIGQRDVHRRYSTIINKKSN